MIIKKKILKHPIHSIIYLLFVFFFIFPLIYTFGWALFFDDSINNQLLLINSNTIQLIGKSSLLALSISFLSTFFGIILGFLLYKTNLPFRHFFKIALLIPLFISPYILAVAWKDFFFLVFQNSQIISSYLGVVLVQVFIFTPLSMIIIGSALSNIQAQLEETGFVITKPRRVIRKVILPLIKPAISTSFILVFIFSISEFSVPAFFGVKVFTTEIFTQFSAFYNHSLAILQSVMLILICIFLLLSERKYIAKAPFFSISGKGVRTNIYNISKSKWRGLVFLFAWLFLSIILPFIVLVVQSFIGGFSSFIQAFELLIPTFSTSISLAFLAALLIVFIGLVAAYSSEVRQKKSLNWLLLIVFAVPSTVIGISLIKFYNHPMLNFIYSSYAIVIIGYVGKFSFISSKLIGNAIKQIPKSLDEAAQMEGITIFTRWWKILIPLIMPTLFVVFVISFIFSLGELGTTIMLYPPGTEMMPIKIFTIMANAPQALTSSMTLIVFSITLFIISSLYFIMKSSFKTHSHVRN